MAWYNPSTWTPIDNIQGQNQPTSGFVSGAGTAQGGGGGGWEPQAPNGASSGQLGGMYVSNQPLPPPTQGGQNTAPQTTNDPYSQWGGTANYNNLVNQFGEQKQNIYNSSMDAAGTAGRGLNSSILDFIDSLRAGQSGIDNAAVNNYLAKQQAYSGILGMVGRGVRSGGVTLANRNAGDSSATGALASAYGELGRRQAANVGNQFAQGENNINLQQQNLDVQRASGARKISESKLNVVDNIVSEARDKLAQLDASMANASLPDRINIDNERNAIKQQVLDSLAQYDAQLNSQTANIQATSPEERRAKAAQLATAGTDLGADAFNFTDQAPARLQNTGPLPSSLPLYLLPRRREG